MAARFVTLRSAVRLYDIFRRMAVRDWVVFHGGREEPFTTAEPTFAAGDVITVHRGDARVHVVAERGDTKDVMADKVYDALLAGDAFLRASLDTAVDLVAKPLTEEMLRAGAARMLATSGYSVHVKVHAPTCAKVTSGGERACRCGADPAEAMFEDELARRPVTDEVRAAAARVAGGLPDSATIQAALGARRSE